MLLLTYWRFVCVRYREAVKPPTQPTHKVAVHIPSQQDEESDSDIEEVRQVLKKNSECSGGVVYNLYCDV